MSNVSCIGLLIANFITLQAAISSNRITQNEQTLHYSTVYNYNTHLFKSSPRVYIHIFYYVIHTIKV